MDRLDPGGYLRPEADLAKVQPQYQGVPEAVAGLLADAYGPRLHSASLDGSVVRGNAVLGRSDLDAVAVLWAARPARTELAPTGSSKPWSNGSRYWAAPGSVSPPPGALLPGPALPRAARSPGAGGPTGWGSPFF